MTAFPPRNHEGKGAIALFPAESPTDVASTNARVAVDSSVRDLEHAREAAMDALGRPGRHLVVGNRTALSGEVPDLVVAWVLAAAPSLAPRRDDLWTVVQEALVNGALHGNLGLEAPSDYDLPFWETVEAHLARPDLAERVLVVDLTQHGETFAIHITDQGAGYTPCEREDEAGTAMDEETACHGRGLALISRFSDELRHENDGRSLVALYHLAPALALPQGDEGLVLLADDDISTRTFLRIFLADATRSRFEEAENGRMALDLTRRLRPNLLVLDMSMPKMDGLEVIKALRADPHFKDLPIMAVTAAQSREERNRILKAGASRIVTKPVDGPLFVELARAMLAQGALVESLRAYHDRTQKELQIARSVQLGVLPTDDLVKTVSQSVGCTIASHYAPCSELGGDYWALRQLDGHRVAVVMVDFTGHGAGPALQTMRLHTFLQTMAVPPDDPSAVLKAINAFLTDVLPVELFATVFYGVVDMVEGCLRYAAAAAPPPLLWLPDANRVRVGDGTGLPAGIVADARHEERRMPFPPGASLLLYSDALYETPMSPDGLPWGEEGLEAMFAEIMGGQGRRGDLPALLRWFYSGAPRSLPDDLTCVWIGRPPEGAGG